MNRGLNTCVNILSVTVPFSCFPLTAVVFPELLPWIIARWCSPNCYPGSFSYVQDHSISAYVQDHGVLGTVMLSVRSTFLWDLRSRRVERRLCFFVFFAIEKVCQHDMRCLWWIVFCSRVTITKERNRCVQCWERKAWRGCVRLMTLFTCVVQCRSNYVTYLKK